jgi:hypothetical protein
MTSRTYRAAVARSTFPSCQYTSVNIGNHCVGVCNHCLGICNYCVGTRNRILGIRNHDLSIRDYKVGVDCQLGLKGGR